MKIAVLIGANSNEHLVSIVSGINIYQNLSDNYIKELIYLDESNQAFLVDKIPNKVELGYKPSKLMPINFPTDLKNYDLIFPVIHGNFGEDGQLQKILEQENIKYIGCGSKSSYDCFDKTATKKVLKDIVPMTSHFEVNLEKVSLDNLKLEIDKLIKSPDFKDFLAKANLPFYVKAARSGSSIGVEKVSNVNQLVDNLFKVASQVDRKILIEQAIDGLEIECAIIEKSGQLLASKIGLIKPADQFYNFESKYNDPESETIIIDSPNQLPPGFDYQILETIRQQAKLIFKKLGCSGLARVDFFLTKDGFYFNEINTMPGFTKTSMYPKLITNLGFSYSEMLDILIKNANSQAH